MNNTIAEQKTRSVEAVKADCKIESHQQHPSTVPALTAITTIHPLHSSTRTTPPLRPHTVITTIHRHTAAPGQHHRLGITTQ
ncbi:hypothetical protein E2C01_055978 [Portunus trituberculatus]|uniref:Uncharacterized protein n=1 Tax=Portunus trituberculatus TaxID=210409 RepID=A0A5B7GP53_PORTR|nr:hypothetical protein [Portunus trituberculatus]